MLLLTSFDPNCPQVRVPQSIALGAAANLVGKLTDNAKKVVYCIVLLLPEGADPIVPACIPSKRLHHQAMGSNTLVNIQPKELGDGG
jgi:hypothetical protein